MWVLALVECAPGCVADEFREKLFVHISPKCVQLRISESSLEIFVSNRDSFETRREGIFSPCEIERFLGAMCQTRRDSLRHTVGVRNRKSEQKGESVSL